MCVRPRVSSGVLLIQGLGVCIQNSGEPRSWVPIVPCDVTTMDQHSYVMTMVPYRFEKYTACQQGDLQRANIDVCTPFQPSEVADDVANDSAEYAIEVMEDEGGKKSTDKQFNQQQPIVGLVIIV